MARRDGTGPTGQGPLTGRGMGGCTGGTPINEYGYGGARFGARAGYGRAFGKGFGRGSGAGLRCRRYGVGYGSFNDKEILEQERLMLKERLNLINKQLEDKE